MLDEMKLVNRRVYGFFKILFNKKCGKWFNHKIVNKRGFGYRCKYCDKTKRNCRLENGRGK